MIIENPPGQIEQLADQRVSNLISHRQSLFLCRHDSLIPEHGQLLRDDWLVQGQCLLEFLHGAPTAYEDLQHADPSRMGQGTKEPGLEQLQLAGGDRFTASLTELRHCHCTTIY